MTLIKWRPFWPDWDEDFFRWPKEAEGFTPAVDVYETKNEVVVETPLAGIDPEKVEITVENNVLKIEGKSEKKSEVEEKNYYRQEIRSGSFYRAVALPTAVQGDKAEAEFDKGMLKVVIPKAEEAKPKTIKIKPKNK